MTTVVGRDRELERVEALVAGGPGTGCLLLRGEAGMGKTTVWNHGVELARSRGFTTALSRPLELDMRIPFAGLHDLLGEVLHEVLEELPDPQRRALDAALLLADPVGPPPDSNAIAFAVLSALGVLASRAPLLIGIDDMQWLDEPSASALRFALHRLDPKPVRLLAAQRVQSADASALGLERVFDPDRFEAIPLEQLSLGSIQFILKTKLGLSFPRPLLLRLYETSGGNPFYALELAASLQRQGGQPAPGRPLPVPENLADLVEERLGALPEATQRALEVAALLSHPTTGLMQACGHSLVDLAPAVGAGVVEIDLERIRFSHPLFASAVAARIGDERRRAIHRALAGVVTDPEQRARHFVLGAYGEDPETAASLQQAADLALARGAPEVAAELFEHSLLHTPGTAADERARRLLAAAQATHLAGDWDRGLALASEAVGLLPGGPDRARALLLVGEIDSRIPSLEQAVVEAGEDARLRAQIRIQLAECCFGQDLRQSLEYARAAAADARAEGDDALLAQALAMQSWFEAATTTGDPEATAASAARLEAGGELAVRGDFTAAYTHATLAMWRDEHEVARGAFQSLRQRAAQRGDLYDQAHALLNLAQVEWRAGDWDRATNHVDAARSLWPRGENTARALTLWMGAVLAAHRGELDTARADAEEGLAAAGEHLILRARNQWVIALCASQVDDALGNLEAAADLFDRAGALEPGMRLFTPDLLDAYLAAQRLPAAEALADQLLTHGAQFEQRRASAIGGRGKALVLAARGEHGAALETLATAAATAAHIPLEHGRTLLALGTSQRRARRRREARASLTHALELFEQLGAPNFAERARAELGRIAGRTPTGRDLTPTEQRIAELVARGHTNREVAQELVLATHTVETALTRIYQKLGLRSRTELAHRLAGGDV